MLTYICYVRVLFASMSGLIFACLRAFPWLCGCQFLFSRPRSVYPSLSMVHIFVHFTVSPFLSAALFLPSQVSSVTVPKDLSSIHVEVLLNHAYPTIFPILYEASLCGEGNPSLTGGCYADIADTAMS